ncbi:MAG TPA: hypothetical protein VK841_24400 [Polyangiaceae bacterium]|jgi:hypothetical protein|nr:hypothetical protein [Polyangiaceae bacterium]
MTDDKDKGLAEPRHYGSEGTPPTTPLEGPIPDGFGRGDPRHPVTVALERSRKPIPERTALWALLRGASARLSYPAYQRFIDRFMEDPAARAGADRAATPFFRIKGYELLKAGTATFLETHCGIVPSRQRGPEPDVQKAEGVFARVPPEDFERLGAWERLTPEGLERRWERYLRETPVNADRPEPRAPVLPYLDIIRRKLGEYPVERQEQPGDVRVLMGIIEERLQDPPMIELIWSYWHEEGMLAQTMSAVARRFQNIRANGRDPLANLELDPLRPLNNVLWGYIQDEQHRLSVLRRAYEYDHHYGFTLHGKAVRGLRPADTRSRFLEAFHNLLHLTNDFYRQDDDTTVVADGFPLLNGLREVHLLLTQGGHNQYGDLPWTARQEMLMEQWILARPEMREFIGGRIMVAYPELWMDRVDSMKQLQGWDETTSVHFRDLGVFGEEILLSIRYDPWVQVILPDDAAAWARYWRPEIQGYMHAYRAVTGVDLRADTTDARPLAERYLPPSVHLRNRLLAQQQQRPR